MYELVKVFVGFSIAGIYSVPMGAWLVRQKILWPETFAVLMLIGFGVVFVFYWLAMYGAEYLVMRVEANMSSVWRRGTGAALGGAEALVFTTLLSFTLMQFAWMQHHFKGYWGKSLMYPKMAAICRQVVNPQFVEGVVMGNDTGVNRKEVLIRTLTDEKLLEAIGK